ncbi:glycosyl hydrolase family protein [Hymenobacter sediminis]|uniref:Ig-like domain-containing protein n=1 Tax=Hymenobacter sediminis TaxID=2218621 RepID=UPI000DA641B6|nr:Ig-like domain-containing protein [Hymenobacter sediminis]RPD48559.1 glycosyl hydrolase family protein [Hymenobacter sediminis]
MKITFYKCVQRVRTQGLALLGGLFFLSQAPAQAQQQLVWEENFNGTTINPSTWTFDQGDGCAQDVCGWGNSELETYTNRPENARVENGNLVIEARRENYQGKAFTSARLKTLGRVQFKYGTLEARIKVPNLQNGLWPAFWMLGASGTWPASGEIDIMEMGSAAAIQAGLTNRRLGGATHWENNNSHAAYDTHYDSPTDLTADYHVYRMSWDSQFIRMFIDGHEYYAIDISKAAAADLEEFHQAQFILLNLAVGGQYTGIYDQNAISAPLPGQMLVDYIRLYQSPGDELYLGSNNSIAGDFGIYTENPAITNRLSYGQDANLYIWNNLTNIAGATPFEGQEVLALRANAGNWFGLGVDNQVKNLVAFNNGALKFQFKTSYAGQFKFGIKSGAGESWVDFPAGVTKHGLLRDGQWHEVVIPMSAFGNGDLGSVTQTFMFAGDAASSQADFYFDNIYYSGGVAANPAPTVSVTSPTNEALIMTPATLTLTANAADANGSVTKVEFYSGFTLVGTATTAPYSATWANVAPGVYTITAKATDNEGVVTTSAPVTVFVAAPNNVAPAVSLTSPTASSSFTTPATITLEANATDSDGTVYKVEFYNGSTLLGTDFTSPYTYTWSGVAAGTYSLTAHVTDNGKVSTTSAPVSVTVKTNVIAGPNFGVYTDNAQISDKLVFGQDANLYIWNNLSNIASPTPFEGPNVLALRAAAGNWFGFGIANDIKNLAAFKDGSLKFQFKTSYAGQFKFGVKTGGAEGWVDFPAGATQYGLQRDGQWHEVIIPLRAFGNLDWASLEQSLMFAGDAPAAQADFFFDHVYYNTQPVVVAPVTYCGTAASGDYSYAVTTTGTSVNFTFHPLGSVAGGNLAILYVNGPGYSMTKNAAGDFTYTLPNQTAGQALSFYFTYAVPGAGERNSAAVPHSYTVGTVCGSTPAPAAPTVSLTSPTASASFTAPATITLTANAADTDGTITKVEFYQGTTLLGTSTASPYTFTWTGAAAGSYSLTAKAYDNAGLSTTSAAVAVTVTGGTTPGGDAGGYCGTAANGDYSWKAVTSGSDVTFTFHPLGATAGGNLAIVYVNGPGYGMTKNSAGDFTYTVANQTSGTALNVYFTYQVGPGGLERNTAATPHSYTVGASCGAAPANVAPTVALTSPTATSFSAPATITLTANAADTDGSISKVEFYQGTTLLGSDATAPYSFTWSNVAAGSYSLTAKAYDDKDLTATSAAVAVTVSIPDADGDGYPANQDCNDQDASINPGAKDACGIDRNCDGKIDLPAQTAPTIAVQPVLPVYTGGDDLTIYLGYGSPAVVLTASAPGARSFSWSPSTCLNFNKGASVVFLPTKAGRYPLTVTATNAAGCTASSSVTITVIDVRGGKIDGKVQICHQGKTQEVSVLAVPAHLRHGDQLGSCPTTAARPALAVAAEPATTSLVAATDVSFYPNPAQGRISLDVALAQTTRYSLSIYDLKGSLVKTISSGQSEGGQQLNLTWDAQECANGIYLVRLITDQTVINKRLEIRH